MIIPYYQCDEQNNIGDSISGDILRFVLPNHIPVKVPEGNSNKLLCVGSMLGWASRNNDTVWGSGLISDHAIQLPNIKILALRGKLTNSVLKNNCEVFGDPAILLPKIYNPTIEIKYKLGVIEHISDIGAYKEPVFKINIQQHWKTFIDQIKSCETIFSSSLHGLIISESYGIRCKKITLRNKIIGGNFKFEDYLSASNRKSFNEPYDISMYQKQLINKLKEHYE